MYARARGACERETLYGSRATRILYRGGKNTKTMKCFWSPHGTAAHPVCTACAVRAQTVGQDTNYKISTRRKNSIDTDLRGVVLYAVATGRHSIASLELSAALLACSSLIPTPCSATRRPQNGAVFGLHRRDCVRYIKEITIYICFRTSDEMAVRRASGPCRIVDYAPRWKFYQFSPTSL
jgi:hypothetical protein